jgi:hypothetical protein
MNAAELWMEFNKSAPGVREGLLGATLFVLARFVTRRENDETLPVFTLKGAVLATAYLLGGALAGFVAATIWKSCPAPVLFAIGAKFPWILTLIHHYLGPANPGGGGAGH